ncbi:MAG: ABC transporter permease [Candidatus Aminicenantales bacterium]|jgi:ABC-type transport system involved in multi-copper enzyme maturation permease subunit
MLKTIIKREILEYLKSAKFLIGLGITLALAAGSTVINVQDYKGRLQDYQAAVQELKSDRFYIHLYRPPQVLSTLIQGKDRSLGNSITITYMGIPPRTSGYMGEGRSQHQRLVSGFAAIDFAFIVRVVLSLMVIFIAYNAVSEEKASGTLKLTLSNRVPRDQLLLGKFLGGWFVIMGSLAVSALVSLIIVLSHSFVSFASGEWTRLLVFIGLSALYLTVFYGLSLFVSVLVDRPSISLMILLQAWVFLIIIYPNLGIIAADSLYKLPSEEQLIKQHAAAFQPYAAEYKKVMEAFSQSVRKGEMNKELGLRSVELDALNAELIHQADEELSRKLTAQTNLARAISSLSPAVLFDQAAERYARTGMAEYERFMREVYRCWQQDVERSKLIYTDREAYKKAPPIDFRLPVESTAEAFAATWLQWLLLAFFGLAFFALAYTAFLKKDVR